MASKRRPEQPTISLNKSARVGTSARLPVPLYDAVCEIALRYNLAKHEVFGIAVQLIYKVHRRDPAALQTLANGYAAYLGQLDREALEERGERVPSGEAVPDVMPSPAPKRRALPAKRAAAE